MEIETHRALVETMRDALKRRPSIEPGVFAQAFSDPRERGIDTRCWSGCEPGCSTGCQAGTCSHAACQDGCSSGKCKDGCQTGKK